MLLKPHSGQRSPDPRRTYEGVNSARKQSQENWEFQHPFANLFLKLNFKQKSSQQLRRKYRDLMIYRCFYKHCILTKWCLFGRSFGNMPALPILVSTKKSKRGYSWKEWISTYHFYPQTYQSKQVCATVLYSTIWFIIERSTLVLLSPMKLNEKRVKFEKI